VESDAGLGALHARYKVYKCSLQQRSFIFGSVGMLKKFLVLSLLLTAIGTFGWWYLSHATGVPTANEGPGSGTGRGGGGGAAAAAVVAVVAAVGRSP